ncbi:MAG: ChrR family anti-sigma-E factor [Paracoccaceae bacterium]
MTDTSEPIRHHLTDDILMAYSAGSLPEAFSLVVATHISLCDECRAQAGAFDAIGGALVGQAEAAPLSADCLERTLARIAGAATATDRAPPPRPGVFPAPLRDYVGGDLDAVRWRSVGMGVRQAILPAAKGATVRLLSIPAGAAMPDHGHWGRELTLVLKGAFRDEGGRYGRGDVEVAGEGLEHRPVAETGEDCICLAATDAPLRFRDWLPRLAQPFLRI